MKRSISVLLICVLAACAPFTAAAQSSDDDSREDTQVVLVGFLVVIFGVLMWLGLKSDMEDWHAEQREMENQLAQMTQAEARAYLEQQHALQVRF